MLLAAQRNYGKTILQKTPHNWVVRYIKINPELTRKLTPYWLAFILPESILQPVGREKLIMVLLKDELGMLQYQLSMQDMHTNAIVVYLL